MSLSCPWGVKGLDKSRFEAYAKLLRLKNGGQIEEASNFSEMLDEEMEPDELDDAGSVDANEFLSFDEGKLKRAFLDRLSELTANEKGGYHVSSSLMIEWPDRVDILVAKNNGFSKGGATLRILETIASSLRDIATLDSSDAATVSTKKSLWESLVQWYKPRIDSDMIRVKKTLDETILTTRAQVKTPASNDCTSSLLSHLEELCALINTVSHPPTQDDLERIVKCAHDVHLLYKEHDFDDIAGKNANTRSLRDALGFLAKLKRMDRSNAWSLKKTLESLDLELNDKTADSLVTAGRKKSPWNKSKLLQKFDTLKASASKVHAETQVILAATNHDCTGAVIFKYVGCSKRSCFLCYRLVQNFGSYTTRGCHGKLYDLWTVPETPWLAGEERSKLIQALKNVEKAMKESIRGGKTTGLVHAPESTIGGSSVATKIPQSGRNPYMLSLVSEYLSSQRQRTRSGADKEGDFTSLEELTQSLPSATDYETKAQGRAARTIPTPEQLQGECGICERETSRRCQFCNLDWFCSEKCQDQMSFYHLTKCSARGITTADMLCRDVIGDQIPQDSETREHFGFTRCHNRRDQSHLLGLYQGLILYLDVRAIQLNEWREKNILVSKIIEAFSKLSENNRGAYFPWFLRNQHILDNSTPPLQLVGEDNALHRAINAARPYLDPEDRDKHVKLLEPPSKGHCFLFFAMVLDSSYPNPYLAWSDSWYNFGFVVFHNQYEERKLGGIYSTLVGGNKSSRDYDESLGVELKDYPNLPTCSFNELWLAYENGELANLFRRYGLDSIFGGNLGLEEFLSFPLNQRQLRPSVWKLKHFLAIDANQPLGNFPEIEAAAQEYGFTAQLNPRTGLALRQCYEQLFRKVNPLRVHEAKSHGQLCEYAESVLDDIDDDVRQVLRKIS
ncbi:hypothetical protein TRIATDRAFT_321317 [Trichoderma atroviride IMI 206040]|uniref:MYND-type domain-containing protein n=1 Tax=Hypocrea atroviridis (strain ATCC 20476 / IMI 206040) TaxID=452589 RepID=G9P928_HYPAI|nr:uncharacterized protein TRIATDRAFT_321317 [Trichoderma atroviride IMI 206040]EHK41056.1 hypothetical protein TRIATDRAFT_321317 [Trichoderma atroviride IMI 206040]